MDFYDETVEPGWLKDFGSHLESDDFDQALRLAQEAETRAKDPRSKALALNALARIQLCLREFTNASASVQKAAAAAAAAKDQRLESAVLRTESKVNLGLYKYQKAHEAVHGSLVLARESGSKAGEGAALMTLATVSLARDKRQEAQKVARQALAVFRDLKDKEGEASCLEVVATISSATKKHPEALRVANDLLGLAEGSGDLRAESRGLSAVLNACLAAGEGESAQQAARKVVDIWQGDKLRQAIALRRFSDACFVAGNNVDGWQNAKQSLELFREVGHKRYEVEMLCQISSAHAKQGNHDQAIMIADEGVNIGRATPDRAVLAMALETFASANCSALKADVSEIQDQQLNWKTRIAGKEALAIYQEIGDKAGEAKMLNVLALAFLSYGNAAECKAKSKAAADICKEMGDKAGEGSNLLLLAKSRVQDNKEEAARLAKLAERLLRESGLVDAAKEASDLLDKVRDNVSEAKQEKAKKPAPQSAAMDKSEITLDIEDGSGSLKRSAHFWGFTSRTAKPNTRS